MFNENFLAFLKKQLPAILAFTLITIIMSALHDHSFLEVLFRFIFCGVVGGILLLIVYFNRWHF